MRKYRLPNEGSLTTESSSTPMSEESEQIDYTQPSTALLPVAEEEDQADNETEEADGDEKSLS